MDLFVHGDGTARFANRSLRCALGRSGVSVAKHEGDGATPLGAFPCRLLYWRADRLSLPATSLPAIALSTADGWCDDPDDPAYNHPVRLPYTASAESLWRQDGVYDLIVPLGYNDAPVVPRRGSAIFLHIAKPGYAPTDGCVALARDDLLEFLKTATRSSRVVIMP